MSVIELRASAVPRISRCPGSATLPQIASTSAPAILGTAIHVACANIVEGNRPDLANIASEHGADADELKKLQYAAEAIWDECGQYFPDATTEVEFPALLLDGQEYSGGLSGHADVVSYPGDGTARIADWKSGWQEGDYGAQLKSYALLAYRKAAFVTGDQCCMGCNRQQGTGHKVDCAYADDLEKAQFYRLNQTFPEDIHRVYVAILWLRDRTIDGEWFDVAELEEWEKTLTATIDAAGTGILQTGEQCRYCPVSDCPAVRAQALAILPPPESLAVPEPPEPLEINAENIVSLHHFRKAAEKRLEDLERYIEQYIRQHGPIEVEGGARLQLSPTTRQKIELKPSVMELLTLNFEPPELGTMLTVSKTALLDSVRAKAPRGDKTAAADQMMDSLMKLGAVTETTTFSVAVKKPAKK